MAQRRAASAYNEFNVPKPFSLDGFVFSNSSIDYDAERRKGAARKAAGSSNENFRYQSHYGGGRAFGSAEPDSVPLLGEQRKKTHFEILGVDRDCSEKQLKKAYKTLAVKLHPDKNPDDPHAQDRFAELNEAFSVLSDPARREEYVKQLPGNDAGWGWNAEAAKRNAKNYHWQGDEMLFQIGGQLNSARCRARRKRGCLSCLGPCFD